MPRSRMQVEIARLGMHPSSRHAYVPNGSLGEQQLNQSPEFLAAGVPQLP